MIKMWEEDAFYFNLTTLCGKQKFVFWDNNLNDFGECFLSLILVCSAHTFLAITTAYVLGASWGPFYLRTPFQKGALRLRAFAALMMVVLHVVVISLLYTMDTTIKADRGLSEVAECVLRLMSWTLQFVYVNVLVERIAPSPRGSRPVLLAFFIVFVVDIIQCRSILMHAEPTSTENTIQFSYAIVHLICLSVYLLTLLPSGDDSQSQYEELITNETSAERQSLTGSASRRQVRHSYGGFDEPMDPDYLGVAKQSVPWLSKLFLYWVNPLIVKGRHGKLRSADDVFDLPLKSSAPEVGEMFWSVLAGFRAINDPTRQPYLLKSLSKTFLVEFLCIGVLKFLADCAGFASPLLLNLVVTFMEDKDADERWGYAYALGLAASSMTVAMCNVHFNLLMNELKLKVRAAVITSVYRHTLSISSVDLATYSTGKIVNAVSTDVDRIVNFFPSLHALWSLPFQFAVTLALLYKQVGTSCLAGVAITILLIPLNKLIADRIGSLSRKMMLAKDDRVKVMAELLAGVRVMKFFAWEDFFSNRIGAHRSKELHYLKGRKYLDAVCVYLWATTPVLISVVTFSMYAMTGNELTAAKVFTAVALFAMLTGPLNAFPWVINGVVEATVSIRRVGDYLLLPHMNRDNYFASETAQDETEVELTRASFSHTREQMALQFTLSELSFTVQHGQFVGVVGKVGSGKSSLLDALIGELNRISGQVFVRNPTNGIGFVQQEPWIQKGTLRDNILFGKVYQSGWYSKVVEACALLPDFQELHAGDETNVGEGGSALSGGQKARVALARAVYQNKEVYLIDDIFSAVDVPVGIHIYKKCIQGLLKEKTRIICTHHPRFLSSANQIIFMEHGQIVETGLPHQILPRVSSEAFFEESKETPSTPPKMNKRSLSTSEEVTEIVASAEDENVERQESGVVKSEIYKKYWVAVGLFLSPAILLSLTFMQGTRNFTDIWLAKWVSNGTSNDPSTNSTENSTVDVDYYLAIYGSIAGANTIFSLIRAFLFAYGGICAAQTIHAQLLRAVMRGKVGFFDTTPLGRILNRFSSDLYTVDDSLPFILNIFLAQLFGVVGHLIVCAYAVPWIILVLVPLAFVLYDVQHRYRPASRDLKRVSSTSLSPIYSHFSETLSGLTTVRAMKAVGRFEQECLDKVEANQKAQYASVAAAQWLELRLQLVGVSVVVAIAFIAVVQHDSKTIDPGLVGLAISYALGITSKLSELVSTFAETERELVAVERCCQYIRDVPQEDLDGGSTSTPYNWPSEGIIEFKNVNFRYREHLPFALKDLSLDTKAREKVGIVGRTGSGKSSLFHVLFRTFDIDSGRVSIDGVDTKILNLLELRRHLTIIPQQPFLFSGTVRENLDPLSKRSDADLWDALKKSYLSPAVERLGGLDAHLEEGGKSFSVGQRQLLCLARAILSSAKIVCVDEATANVDFETDRLIQEVLRTSLYDCTVITIAHRVDTVLGSDRVVVMARGRTLENGHPNILLQDPNSEFSKHVATH